MNIRVPEMTEFVDDLSDYQLLCSTELASYNLSPYYVMRNMCLSDGCICKTVVFLRQ
jgi:hypothetical protein